MSLALTTTGMLAYRCDSCGTTLHTESEGFLSLVDPPEAPAPWRTNDDEGGPHHFCPECRGDFDAELAKLLGAA